MRGAVLQRAPRHGIRPTWLWLQAFDASVQYPTLVKFGLFITFVFLAMVFSPDPVYANLRYFLHPLAYFWIGLALIKAPRRIHFSLPYILLLVLQIWMVVSMVVNQTGIDKAFPSQMYLFYPLEMGTVYLLVTLLSALMPAVTRYIINFFLLLVGISAFVAMLQALHFGPAIKLADFYVYRSIEGWDAVEGIRASGICSNPNTNVMSLLVGAGLIAYKSTLRRLNWFDWSLWSLLLAASFFAQHRSSMPLIGLVFVFSVAIMGRRRPQILFALLSATAVCILVVVLFFEHSFSYTFEQPWSANAPQLVGREVQEAAAAKIFKDHEYFGIGPSPAPETLGLTSSHYDIKVESLYYSIMLTTGYPGLAIVVSIYVGGLVLGIAFALKRDLTLANRAMAGVGAIGAFALLWNGIVAVNISLYHVMFTYMMLLGIVQATLRPLEPYKRRDRVSPYLQRRDELFELAR